MSKNGTVHQHIIDELRALTRSGQFPPGAKFLTEREIAERFDTSRPTANKALSSLASAGVLEVRRGAGTFVREGVLDYDLERLVSFTDKAKAAGKKPGTELLEYRSVIASSVSTDITGRLQVADDDILIYMERIRLADDCPVIYESRHVVARLCPQMKRRHARGSLYACWTEKCGLNITGAEEIIRAVNATQKEANYLGIQPGAACFKIIATGHIDGGTPLWHEETLYRAEIYEFRNRIGGVAGPPQAALGQIKP
jgi:GntR family transcriptional regulator